MKSPVGLPPDPLVIDGNVFDPGRHFQACRKRGGIAMAQLRLAAEDGLRTALAAEPEAAGRWRAVAILLNDRGTTTVWGGAWTAENVRKLAGRNARRS